MIVIANVFPKLQTVQDLVRPLSKKRRVITSFESHHVKRSQALVKSSWEHFYHIFPSPWREMIWETFPLFKFEMIGVFVNVWTVGYKYPVSDCENFLFPIQMKYLKNQINFLSVLFSLWNLHLIWTFSKKRWSS